MFKKIGRFFHWLFKRFEVKRVLLEILKRAIQLTIWHELGENRELSPDAFRNIRKKTVLDLAMEEMAKEYPEYVWAFGDLIRDLASKILAKKYPEIED
jgi:hypothetical protein